jgi:alpha-galactosidase
MSCHVSVCPNHQCGRTTDFESRAAIAGLGAFGYELDTTKLSESEKEALRKYNQQYLKDEELILRGDLFRLISPFEQNLFAEMVVSKDKSDAILTVMVPLAEANKAFDRIKLYGLDANRQYLCEEEEKYYFGTELINRGFDIPNTFGDFKTIVRHFRAV